MSNTQIAVGIILALIVGAWLGGIMGGVSYEKEVTEAEIRATIAQEESTQAREDLNRVKNEIQIQDKALNDSLQIIDITDYSFSERQRILSGLFQSARSLDDSAKRGFVVMFLPR